MTLAIVAYPNVSADDQRWVEEIRRAHDPEATLIAAHFTLVFPVDVQSDELAEHAKAIVSEFCAIPFALRSARAVPGRKGAHVFLVPERGATEIVALHDALYRGRLEAHLRADIPFIPHVTVAAYGDVAECERLAAKLNSEGLEIFGEILGVDIVAGEGQAQSIAHFRLGR